MDQREDDLRTVSDFLGAHPQADVVYLDTYAHIYGREMGDGLARSVPITDDVGPGWHAAIRVTDGFNLTPDIDQRVLNALNRLFAPSRRRSCGIFHRPKASIYVVTLTDVYAGRTEYSAEGDECSFGEAVAGALAAEKAEIERLTLLDRMFAVVKGWSENVFVFPKGEEPLDVIRGALSMAERIFVEDVDKDGEMRVALDLIRAGMRMVRKAREDGVPEPVETLFDLFDTLTRLEGNAN